MTAKRDLYVPVEAKDIYASFEVEELPQGFASVVVYNLTKEYEITRQGLRRWKKDGGRIRAYYCPKGKAFEMAYVDEVEPLLGDRVWNTMQNQKRKNCWKKRSEN